MPTTANTIAPRDARANRTGDWNWHTNKRTMAVLCPRTTARPPTRTPTIWARSCAIVDVRASARPRRNAVLGLDAERHELPFRALLDPGVDPERLAVDHPVLRRAPEAHADIPSTSRQHQEVIASTMSPTTFWTTSFKYRSGRMTPGAPNFLNSVWSE